MAEFELRQLSNHTYYIASRSNIGIYEENGRVILIDSGVDKEAGRQALKLVRQKGWEIDRIINTHSNADHIGGNAFIQKRTSCGISATAMEAPFITHPVLEPSFVSGGYPHPRLRNKFLLATASEVTDIIDDEGPIPHTPLDAVPLPGHFFQMIGVHTPDEVLFTADALIPPGIIEKYHIFYLYDIKSHLETLSALEEREDFTFVPSHGDPVKSIGEIISVNRAKIFEISDRILNYCGEPETAEGLLAKLCSGYGLELNANQYALLLSTLRSYLAYLMEDKKVEVEYTGGWMKWRRR